MDAKKRYEMATQAVNAGSALNMLEMAAQMLEALPYVDSRLQKLESTLTVKLRAERNRMLDVMDAAHFKAGTPRPY